MEFLSRGAHSTSATGSVISGVFVLAAALAGLLISGAFHPASGQLAHGTSIDQVQVEAHAVALQLGDRPTKSRDVGSDGQADDEQKWNTRQVLLIGGLAASMAAYGYFILEFNNSRGAASSAERAYEEDVRQNAQTYLDQGIKLDEIPAFRDWQAAYDDAKHSREWGARAGFLAIVIGFFAVLDAATTYDGPSPSASGISIHPTVNVTSVENDLLVGARLKF